MNTHSPLSDIAGLTSRLTAKALKSLSSAADDKAQDLIFRNVMAQQGWVDRVSHAVGRKGELPPPGDRKQGAAADNNPREDHGVEAKRTTGPRDGRREHGAVEQDAEPAATGRDTDNKTETVGEPVASDAGEGASGPAEGGQVPTTTAAADGSQQNTTAPLPLEGAQARSGDYGVALPREGELLPLGESVVGTSSQIGRVGPTVAASAALPLSDLAPGATKTAEVKALTAAQAETLGVRGEAASGGNAATVATEINKTGFGAGLTMQNLFSSGTVSKSEADLIAAASAARRPQPGAASDAVQTLLTKLGPRLAVQQYQSTGDKAAVMQTGVQVPMGDPKWQAAVHERVMWLASQNISSAEIHLDPPELGPLQVKISMAQEQVQVTFTSHHASVREALDQGAYRLREMFEDRGLNLMNVDVSDQSFAQGSEADSGRQGHGGDGSAGQAEEAETVAVRSPLSSQLGLVDHYV